MPCITAARILKRQLQDHCRNGAWFLVRNTCTGLYDVVRYPQSLSRVWEIVE